MTGTPCGAKPGHSLPALRSVLTSSPAAGGDFTSCVLWLTTASGLSDHACETPSVPLPGTQEFSQEDKVEAGLQVAQSLHALPWLSAPSAAWGWTSRPRASPEEQCFPKSRPAGALVLHEGCLLLPDGSWNVQDECLLKQAHNNFDKGN